MYSLSIPHFTYYSLIPILSYLIYLIASPLSNGQYYVRLLSPLLSSPLLSSPLLSSPLRFPLSPSLPPFLTPSLIRIYILLIKVEVRSSRIPRHRPPFHPPFPLPLPLLSYLSTSPLSPLPPPPPKTLPPSPRAALSRSFLYLGKVEFTSGLGLGSR